MIYTNSITSKGQITLPKEFRDKLGLDKLGQAQIRMNTRGEIVITPAKSLAEVRAMLSKPTHAALSAGRPPGAY
jgi:antitoxin PrlF